MAKISKPFQFNYDLKKKVVRDLKIVTEKLTLKVTGIGYMNPSASVLDPFERWSCDIESIEYNGINIIEVLDFFGIEEIEEVACKAVAQSFSNEKTAA